jgi:hypothetical protein
MLTMLVNVFGDPHEEKTLSFLWFKESKTLYEFYGGQRSLRRRVKNIAWFPTASALMTHEDIYAFFDRIPASIVWNYIDHPTQILSCHFKDYGCAKWSYIDRYADGVSTRLGLAGCMLNASQTAAVRIQRAWRERAHSRG